MLWKLLRLQKLLDSLFEDGWVRIGLPEESAFTHLEAFELMQS
jgi:hypothetical protein